MRKNSGSGMLKFFAILAVALQTAFYANGEAVLRYNFDDESIASFDGTVTDSGSSGNQNPGTVSSTNASWAYLGSYNDIALVYSTAALTETKITGISINTWGQKFVLEAKIWKGNEADGNTVLLQSADGTTIKWYIDSDNKLHLDLNNGTNSAAINSFDAVLTDGAWTEIYTVVDLSQTTYETAFKFYTRADGSSSPVTPVTIANGTTALPAMTLNPANKQIELILKDAEFTLKTDFIKITADASFTTAYDANSFEGLVESANASYVAPNSSSSITVNPAQTIRRVSNPGSDIKTTCDGLNGTVVYDSASNVFYGVFEISVTLKASDIQGPVTVNYYINKPGETTWKKIGKVDVTMGATDQIVKFYWNSRVPYSQADTYTGPAWSEADTGAYRSSGPVRFKFEVK